MEELSGKTRDGGMDLDAVRKERESTHRGTMDAVKALRTPEQSEKWGKAPDRPKGATPEGR